MLQKSLMVLKRNPIIFIMMVVFMLLMAVISLPMISKSNKIMDFSSDLYNPSDTYPQIDIQDSIDMMVSSLMILAYSLVIGFVSLAFMSGYGNMITAAINEGKASLKIFLYGFRKFFGKVLLSALLLAGIIIGFSIVISLITTPLIIAAALTGSFNSGDFFQSQRVMQIVINVIMIFLYPLLLMWLPALFTDRQDGVIKCFKNGLRASRKKYLRLLPATALMMLPSLLLFVLSENIYETLKTPNYYLIYPFQALILPVVITYLFVIYKDFRSETSLVHKESETKSAH